MQPQWQKAIRERKWVLWHQMAQVLQTWQLSVNLRVSHDVITTVMLEDLDKLLSRDGNQVSVQYGKLLFHIAYAFILVLANHDINDSPPLYHEYYF